MVFFGHSEPQKPFFGEFTVPQCCRPKAGTRERENIKSQVPNSNYTTQTEGGLPVVTVRAKKNAFVITS